MVGAFATDEVQFIAEVEEDLLVDLAVNVTLPSLDLLPEHADLVPWILHTSWSHVWIIGIESRHGILGWKLEPDGFNISCLHF